MTDRPAELGASAGVDRWVRAHPVIPDAVLAIVIAALTASSSLPLVWRSQLAGWLQTLLVVAISAAYIAVAVRRVAPEAAYAVGVVDMALLLATPDLTGAAAAQFGIPVPAIVLPASVVYLVLLYSVAAYGRGRTPLYALIIGLVGAVLTSTRLWLPDLWSVRGLTIGWTWKLVVPLALLSAVVVPWILGRFRRLRGAYVLELEGRARREEQERRQRAEQAAAAERTRIAREMHDVVAHSLSVMVAQAEGARLVVGRDPGRAAPVLQTIAATGREALGEMRGLLGVLRTDGTAAADRTAAPTVQNGTDTPTDPSGTDLAGAVQAPQPTLEQLPDLIARVRAAGLQVDLQQHGTSYPLGRSAQLAVFRLVQEALTNVVKHGGQGASAEVTLGWEPTRLVVTVSDHGSSTAVASDGSGHGLIGMRERVTQVGGTLSAGPVPGGYVVSATLPSQVEAGQR